MKKLVILLIFIFLISNVSAYTIYYYHNDNQGNPVAITDEQGEIVWKAEYEPFGSIFNEEEIETSNKYNYNTKELDKNTDLLYYGNRYYDSNLGRFTTADTIKGSLDNPQSLNRYSYTLNNPLKYIDPSGNQGEKPERPLFKLKQTYNLEYVSNFDEIVNANLYLNKIILKIDDKETNTFDIFNREHLIKIDIKKTFLKRLIGSCLSCTQLRVDDFTIPFLFEEPGDNRFKVCKPDETFFLTQGEYDFGIHNFQHFYLSTGSSASLTWYFDSKGYKHPWLYSGGITLGLGLLKEFEDGFREGFSYNDLLADGLGTATGIISYYWIKELLKKEK